MRSANESSGKLRVSMSSDTLDLSPAEYASLLTDLAKDDPYGTDSYGSGGVVDVLEARMAETLGKPAAVIMPTGTMSNLLAVQFLAGKARKAIVQTESHLYNDCGDCAQSLAGINLIPLGAKATFDADDIARVIDRIDNGKVAAPIGVISIESPVRRLDGEMFEFGEMQAVCEFARKRNIRLHLDGARLFVGSVYSGQSLTDFTAMFDTVYVSLYKNFNTLSGAILAGPAELIDQLRHWRRRNGGGLAQWWPVAAVALHYHDGLSERLKSAAADAEKLYGILATDDNFKVTEVANGSSVRYVSCPGKDLTFLGALRTTLRRHSIDLPKPDNDKLHFALKTNESWLRSDPQTLAGAFVDAISN